MSDSKNDAGKDLGKNSEKPVVKDSGKAKAESDQGLSDIGKQVKEQRKQQHESGKSGATNKFGLSSAKDILGDAAHGKAAVKQESALRSRLESDKGDAVSAKGQVSKYEKATQTLLETACQRFGKDKIDAMHIKKDDMSTAVSALLLGPDACKAMGPDETAKFGKRLIVFGIAPAFGMADEAKKEFSKENMKGTAHEASSNFLTGTAIGAVLERAHPLVMGGAIIGGGALFLNDQANSPEHKERNAKVAHIAGKVDNASNDDLANYAKQTRQLIGPDAYKGVFVVVTGGAGLPEGQALKAGVKEETAHALAKMDVKDLVNSVKNMGKDAMESIASVFKDHTGLHPAPEGVPKEILHAPGPRADVPKTNILKMQGKGGWEQRMSHPGEVPPRGGNEIPRPELKIAEQVRAKAEKAEKVVTKDISSLAEKAGGTMEGLEHKLKSVDSMARKIRDEGQDKINDALRYTTTFPTEKLASKANQVMAEMEKMGYEKLRVKNTFDEGHSYIGINTTFKKDGQVFELQFHTPESLHVKEHLNHKLYEVRRELDHVSNAETGEVTFKPPEDLQKVVEKYAVWLKDNHPQIAALGQVLMDEIRTGKPDAQKFADALSEQMLKHNESIPIPKDTKDIKTFKKG